jgi:hypothetical protein
MRVDRRWFAALGLAMALLLGTPALAQTNPVPMPGPTPVGDGTFLLTVFLKHDQSRPLGKLNEQLKDQGFFKAFPPPGVQVVSWYVVMGIGQVVTLRVPTGQLREVNRILEDTAWGAYHTEFYPTYDFKAIAEQSHAQAVGK